jgi:mitochondrial import receptor subunit TOM40
MAWSEGEVVHSSSGFFENNALFTILRDTYSSFSERRKALGLSNPGTVENIAREVQKDVFLTNSMFTGLRADLTKPSSINPLFQVSHAFSMGSQGLPPYTFLALYGTSKVSVVVDSLFRLLMRCTDLSAREHR